MMKKVDKRFLVGGFPGGSVNRNLPANAGDMVRSLVLEDSTRHLATKAWAPQLLSPSATTTEAHAAHSLCSTMREATVMRSPSAAMKTQCKQK